ncbi:MAG TPA: hypothetical protein VKQ70_02505 [Caulobacteraceae bacterium]|jgi:hypothetical protein|nr:hypothetical protein [Caulobacteraceae bacterium]
MPDNDLQLLFGADASGVTQGVDQAKAAIAGFGPKVEALSKSFSELAAQLKTGLGGLQALAKGLQSLNPGVAQAIQDQQKLTEANAKGIADRARDEQKAIADRLGADRAVLAEKISAVQVAAAAGTISAGQEASQIASLRQQEGQDELDAANRSYQIQQGALDQRLALYAKDSAAYENVLDKEAVLAEQYSDQITKIKANALKQQDEARKADFTKMRQEFDAAVSPLVSSFNSGLLKMAEGTQTFAQTMRGLGDAILQDFLKIIDKMVTQWIVGQIMQLAISRTTTAAQVDLHETAHTQITASNVAANLKQIQSDAAAAAGAAYKAMAGVPPAPLWGVLAGAAAFAGVMAFEGLASAAGGFDVPSGANPLAQLHAQEMVLPARLANPMRSMMDDYAAARGGPPIGAGFQTGGDTHVHNYNISALDAGSFTAFLRGNKDPLSIVLQEMGRAGMKTA